MALTLAAPALAGPTVNVTDDASSLASALLGSGVTLSGIPTLTAGSGQAGTFTNGPSLLGFSSGVVLSSGLASSASGNYAGANLPSAAIGSAGSPALSGLIGQTTNDAAVLSFSFIPNSSQLFFQYVFASAEYPNFINAFNDVFGFFVNGTNYATLPGTNTPVSINSVNAGVNSQFFNKYNTTGDQLPYGGETNVLTFTAPVNAGKVNTISLDVADALDEVLDSAVFIEAGTVSTAPPTTTPPVTTPIVSAVPEPSTYALVASGLALLGLMGCRRRKF